MATSTERAGPVNAARRSLNWALLAGLAAGAGLAPAWAQTEGRYRSKRAHPDGIGKVYMDREISGVMGWQGAAWLEREEREREERGDLLVAELGLRPGMQVADIGAGTGYYARRMAARIQPAGTVFAVDVQPEMIAMLTELARKNRLDNIRPVQATVTDVKLPPASTDLALLVDVYHELEYPYEAMASVVSALKPGGRLVLVEYRAEDPKVPIKALHKMSLAQIKREMTPHSLVYDRASDVLPWQHIVIFRRL